jgi:hypothetical protein
VLIIPLALGAAMNALEKVAWMELIVSSSTLALAALLYPWLGLGATGAFGLLGLLAGAVWFVRRRGNEVIMDERDQAIARNSMLFGIGVTWMGAFMTLLAIVLWSSYYNGGVVPTSMLTWLLWTQFAVCYALKGLVAVLAYRRQTLAA